MHFPMHARRILWHMLMRNDCVLGKVKAMWLWERWCLSQSSLLYSRRVGLSDIHPVWKSYSHALEQGPLLTALCCIRIAQRARSSREKSFIHDFGYMVIGYMVNFSWSRRRPCILHDHNQLNLGEQSRAAERFIWSEFQLIPAKGADLRLLWFPVVTANSLALEHSMAG